MFYRYKIDLQNYQLREVRRPAIIFDSRYENLLIPYRKKCEEELNWDKMWTIEDARTRFEKGCDLIAWKPFKTSIYAWLWLMNSGWIVNAYVFKKHRGHGLFEQLVYKALNRAMELDYPYVYLDIDDWNTASLLTMDNVLKKIGCYTQVSKVEEEYSDHLIL